MIKIYLGNLGSGKTVYAVKEMADNVTDRKFYTNIITNNVPNVIHITPENVILKIPNNSAKSGFKMKLNTDFWMEQKKHLYLVWDEIHLTANSRSSLSSVNMVLSRFISMGRRIVGIDKRGYGHFIFIAQSERTVDANIRDLANEIYYFRSIWTVECEMCHFRIVTNSDRQQIGKCLKCGSWKILKKDISISVFVFAQKKNLSAWECYYGFRNGLPHITTEKFVINNIENYFKYYDTLQMEDIWNDYIDS